MRPARTAVAAVGLVVIALAGQPPAFAGTRYSWLDCGGGPSTTGVLTGFDASASGAGPAWATGTVAPCRVPTAVDVFAMASYDIDGFATGWAEAYPAGPGYSAYVWITPKTAAVCVIDDSKHRLDCLEVKWVVDSGGAARPQAGVRVPVDSPVVAAGAAVDLDYAGPQPGCPTCVDN